MPVNICWSDEAKSIIYGEIYGQWTWDEYHQTTDRLLEMTAGLTYRIDQIIDVSRSERLPEEGSPIAHFKKARQSDPLNPGITVIVGADYVLQGLVKVLEEAFGNRFPPRYLVGTIEEAYQLISDSRKQIKED